MWWLTKKPERDNAARLETTTVNAASKRQAVPVESLLRAARSERLQAKLRIGTTGGQLEQEAERVAGQVMRMPEPRAAASVDADSVSPESAVQRAGTAQTTAATPAAAADAGLSTAVQALEGGGRPLPKAQRGFFEPRFGTDFSRVRIHDDSRAAGLARSIDARAFTVGHHLVFGSGEYAPGTRTGRYLLAHELTHVLQQGRAATPAGGTASHTLVRPRSPQYGLLQRKKTNTRHALKAQEIFWNDLKTCTEPGVAEFRNAITASSYDPDQQEMVKAINPQSRLEIRLNKKFFKEKDAAVRMQAINAEVRIFKKGYDARKAEEARKAAEEEARKKAAEAARLAKIIKAKQDIVDTFKVKAVTDGDKDWTEAELLTLKDAFTMLPAADQGVLKGVEIKRVISLGGKTAGQFSYSVDAVNPGDTSVGHAAVMEIADLAYSGSAAETKRIIAHEVGHGIAGAKVQEANVAHAEAVIALNQKAEETTDSFNRLTAANEKLQAAIDAYNEKKAEYKKEKDAALKATLKQEMDTLYADYKAKRAVSDTLLKENKADAAAEAKARTESKSKEDAAKALMISSSQLSSIKTAVNTAKTTHAARLSAGKKKADALDMSDTEIKAYHDAVLKVSEEVTGFFNDTKAQDKSEKDVEALIKTVDTRIEARNNARTSLVTGKKGADMIAAFSQLESTQDALFEAAKKHSLARKRNRKVQEFADFVEANHIAPITPYAAENWPHKPEEFYAEAYSYWVTGRLKAVSAKLNKWFDDGHYK